jgi:hypothetical protein
MTRFTPITLEYNSWNGFILELFSIETDRLDRSLLHIYASTSFFMIGILGFKIITWEK